MLFFVVLSFSKVILEPDDEVTVRAISVAPPPPPPPREIIEQIDESVAEDNSINISVSGQTSELTFSTKPKLKNIKVNEIERPNFDFNSIDLKKTLAIDFPQYEIKDLDEMPRIVSSTNLRIPRSLRDRGIKRVDTIVDILIDEVGRPYIKEIIEHGYIEMDPVIRKYLKGVRFSPPKKDGRPVQAVYTWTLRFIESF